ncbi:MAG: hypothetical protein ABIF77_13530 [bacterium]
MNSTDLTFLTHLGQMLLCGFVLAAPVPLCLVLLSRFTSAKSSPPDEHRHADVSVCHSPVSCAHNWLVLLVGWSLVQTVLPLLLGIFGIFNLAAILGGEAGLLAVGILAWFVDGRAPSSRPGIGFYLLPRGRLDSVTASLLLLVLVMIFTATWNLLRQPTTNFDSVVYHLPTMAHWVREGGFEVFRAALYPMNWELLSCLPVLPLGEDLLVSTPNLLAWLQLGLVVYLLSRFLGAERPAAATASCILLSLPILLARLDAIQPDIAMAALFLSGLYFALRFARTAASGDLVLHLACLAMLWGIKLSGPAYACLLLATLVVARYLRIRELRQPGRQLLRISGAGWVQVITALPVLLLVQGYWYARNFHWRDNPLGMVEWKIGGTEILRGHVTREYLDRTTLAAVFDPGRGEDWRVLYEVFREWLGLPFLVLALLAVLALIRSLIRTDPQRDSDLDAGDSIERSTGRPGRILALHPRWILFLLIAITGIAYWFTPYGGDNGEHGWRFTAWFHVGLRYSFSCLGLLAVAAALGLQQRRLGGGWLSGLAAVTCMLGVVLKLEPPIWALRVSVLLAATLAGLLLHWDGTGRRRPATAVALIGLVLVCLAVGCSWPARQERATNRVEAYGDIYPFLEMDIAPTAVVGYVNYMQSYPFFGLDWRRKVVPALPEATDRQAWRQQLRDEAVEILIVGRTPPQPKERAATDRVMRWVNEEDAGFTPIFGHDDPSAKLVVYRVR